MAPRHSGHPRAVLAHVLHPSAFVAMIAAVLAGCGGTATRPAGALTPADFVGAPERTQQVRQPAVPQPRPIVVETIDAARFATGEGDTPATEDAGPLPPIVAPGPSTRPTLLDVKVGEVNNKPIFASEFLRPLASRLEAGAYEIDPATNQRTGRLVPRRQWQQAALTQVIQPRLAQFIENELVIAEGLAQFTPAERAGLRAWLGLVRENLAQRSGGSLTQGVRNLGGGETLSGYLRTVQNQQIIRQFAESIRRGIVVTRSDVQRRYIREYVQDPPEAVVTLRWIQVRNSNPQGIERIATRLARGEDFADIATDDANRSRRSTGGLWADHRYSGRFEEGVFFRSDAINEAIRDLTPGEWAGPIDDGRDTNWLYLESFDPGFKTWAEAQSELREDLRAERFLAEYARQLRDLQERAGVSDTSAMELELLRVATDWFYPEP
ncbi:MAG: hypothetical protein AAFX79_12730 [Planctomycetota bacterium]